jgi:membrane protease YdiL (CAAX protease family)
MWGGGRRGVRGADDLIFAILYIATGNLAEPVIAHAGFDAVVFAGGIGALWRIYSQV